MLVEHGFLFESPGQGKTRYRFASSMYQKVWMYSRYTKSAKIWKDGIAEFLIDVVCRMRGEKLSLFVNEKDGPLRDNQIQQEFYYAISTAVPANVNVVPEWET